MRNLLKLAFRNKRVAAYLREIYDASKLDPQSVLTPETTVPEAEPIRCRQSAFNGERLNLLVPSLDIRHVFGGISTALAFFNTLTEGFANVRIILTDQQTFTVDQNPAFSDCPIGTLDGPDEPGWQVIPAGDRYGKTLAVGHGDRFIATAWWTAVSARFIQRWQSEFYGFSELKRFVYLIQDYEPGFYAWSSRYALAEDTYHDGDRFVAVFNTSMLETFFDQEGYSLPHTFAFEPTLNTHLQRILNNSPKLAKERRVLVYGRPGTPRNAFEIIAMALVGFVASHPETDWEFVSAGETHAPVDLGHGKQLVSLGKLSIDEYAEQLGRAAIGVSLMISPHPSYPPLEMAAFGAYVVTNRYKSKDLSKFNQAIFSVESASAESVMQQIERCIDMHLQKSASSTYEHPRLSPAWENYLTSDLQFEAISAKTLPLIFDRHMP